MKSYLLIVSQDPSMSVSAVRTLAFARDLVAERHHVTVYLTGAGVLAAQRRHEDSTIATLCRAGARARADADAARMLGVSALCEGVEATNLDPLLEAAVTGARVMWN